MQGLDLPTMQADLAAVTSQPSSQATKGIAPMPVTPVDPKTLAAQIAAGNEAMATMIKADVPGWEQHLIPGGAIAKGVEAVVLAANSVRDNPPA